MYQKQIEQLVVLQTVDDEIMILEAEVREAPLELTGLETKVAQLRGARPRSRNASTS
jgi:hypothetical protein